MDLVNFSEDCALSSTELKKLKEKLIEIKSNLLFKNKYSDEFNLDQEDLSDDVDHASAQLANYHHMRFRNRENIYEKKIDEALQRMDKCSYGICKDCGGPIKFSRLMARPTAEFCIDCKEESEKDESSSIFGQLSKSSGRMINLYSATLQ